MVKRKKAKKPKYIMTLFISLLLLIGGLFTYKYMKGKHKDELNNALKLIIEKKYNSYVKTNKEANLFTLKDGTYTKVGTISKGEELSLDKENITYKTKYFKSNTLDDTYYIKYQDVTPIDKLSDKDGRYKKYIPFNQNIVTKDVTHFYQGENLIYTINKSFDLPIIIKKTDIYGVVYNDTLLYVKKEDVESIKDNKNTELSNTSSIAALNYHFFYDETKESERKDCNQIICHPKTLFASHLKYIKDNNIFTPTMKEFEMYLDKQINLPKSVLITIDDGWRMYIAIDLLEEYQLNGTVFLITSWFKDPIKFLNDYKYVEFHSHGDDLHKGGECPGGQGGAIKCRAKDKLLADLATSRKKLNNTTTFCYPFYEYNEYSISILKEAGFTMSFAGGFNRATPGVNKYIIPRFVVYNDTTTTELKSYIG